MPIWGWAYTSIKNTFGELLLICLLLDKNNTFNSLFNPHSSTMRWIIPSNWVFWWSIQKENELKKGELNALFF